MKLVIRVGTQYMEHIHEVLKVLQERNRRVEADKAWETSVFRKALISLITYVVASVVLYSIGVENFYVSALIPTLGFLLSTLSLPPIKAWWIRNRMLK